MPFTIELRHLGRTSTKIPVAGGVIFVGDFCKSTSIYVFSPRSELKRRLFRVVSGLRLIDSVGPCNSTCRVLGECSIDKERVVSVFGIETGGGPGAIDVRQLRRICNCHDCTCVEEH